MPLRMPNHTTKLRRTYRPAACFPRFMRKRGRECAKNFGNMSGERGVAFSSAPPEGGFPTRMGLRQAAASPAVSRGMFWIPACAGMPHGAPLSRLAARAILSRQARDGGWIPACAGMTHGPCSGVHFTPASLSWKGQMRAGFGENALQSLFLGSRDRYDGK